MKMKVKSKNISLLFLGIAVLCSFSACSWLGFQRKYDLSKLSKIERIRHFSGNDYSRVAIDMNKGARYKVHRVDKSDRIYIDIYDSYLSKELIAKRFVIKDGILKNVRSLYYKPTTVRVIMDVEELQNYKVFSLNNPFRVVVDFMGIRRDVAKNEKVYKKPILQKKGTKTVKKESGSVSLLRQLGLGVNTIVIDAGHGGKDPGAIGINGLREKDVVLDVARRLKKLITEKYNLNVIMTRDRDIFIPLEERTAIANARGADLFISIHANASRNIRASGIETYYLNLTNDPYAIEVAARENSATTKNISDLQDILKDLMKNTKISESSTLARIVQNHLPATLSQRYSYIKSLGVKKAPFYVLIGANMPSILVEISFITNPREGRNLASPQYRQLIAEGICNGISEYVSSLSKYKGNLYSSGK
ncbi:MAG: N-acetylmuramoyl-L-alanine amidase [Candidatus Schekmanbacteria bacterium]|nr:MAG: N-acetylmuramoyl-L-alanine amidase [Candidatus Schekmanbacteria bacterium]